MRVNFLKQGSLEMAELTVFKTFTFKIHNLPQGKKSKLNKSMTQGTMVFYKLVFAGKEAANKLLADVYQLRTDFEALTFIDDKAKKEAEKDLNKNIRALKREGLSKITKLFTNITKPLPFGSAIKDGAVEDASAQISSYIELTEIGQQANLPQKHDAEIDYHLALNDLLSSTTKEQEDAARDAMARSQKNDERPITLSRYRETMILADDKNRLFVFPLLWSAKDKRSTPVLIDAIDTRTGESYKKKSGQGMLLPLECSNRHKQALMDGTAKTSKIYKRGDDYYLAVAVEFKIEAREPKYVMGIDRGICEIASYAVRDKETGKIVATGTFDGLVLREHQRLLERKQKLSQARGKRIVTAWSGYTNNLMHNISKEIVEIADKWCAQVVIEDLKGIKNGAHHKRKAFAKKGGFRRMLSRQQYGKLEGMLDYKLQAVGLPKPLKVQPEFTSRTCPQCGDDKKGNRLKDTEELRAIFHCHSCGYKAHSDINAAVNIAGKRIWFDANKGKMKKGRPLPALLRFNVWQSDNLQL